MSGTGAATSTVIDYFANVLRREPLEEVTFHQEEAFIATPREQIVGGSLTEDHTRELFAAHDEGEKRSRSEKGEQKEPDPSISVAISLATVSETDGATQHGLLLLGATLYRDGRLEPELETGTSPWIPAERLSSPSVTDREVMAGRLRDFWAFVLAELSAEASRTTSISDAMELAHTLFQRVSGRSIADFAQHQAAAGHFVEHETCYIREHDRINAVGGLLAIYEALARAGTMPPILARMVQGWDGARHDELRIHDGDGLLGMARLACGSMSDKRALTPSQRRAVHAFLQDGDGDVTAVSGPPGTGKTTMLQAIVAGMITRRALDQADAPVIVGTSTNNQAVTNIITSFASVVKDEPGDLDVRWLPEATDDGAGADPLRSLAVYCPSAAKLPAAKKKYLVEQKNRSELYADFSSAQYLQDARDHFMGRVQRFFGGIPEPSRVQDWIYDALTEVDGYRLALLGAMSADGRSEDYLRLCEEVEASEHLRGLSAISALRKCASLEELDEALDRTLRYAEFWLAVHYYEVEWLDADHLGEAERFKSTWTVSQKIWPQAAALTPCFVMTLYQVPKFFGRYSKPGEPRAFDLGRIDLLIADEAGQVDTALALPVLALAKRALVVGDEKQLSPVWSLDEETDREIAEDAGVEPAVWTDDLRERGVTASARSSLMRTASHASWWSFGDDEPGLLLREHFRCHPDIIAFNNELLYNGLLEARRPAEESLLHGTRPAFEWVDVPDSKDIRKGSSRTNQPEAKAIATWIVENYGSLYDLYHRQRAKPEEKTDAAQLIGVVTPFRAQADVITDEIRKAATTADTDRDVPRDLARKITVGTAHSLQGAERPIVLFSAVYGCTSAQSGFVDQNPELMNVAVSRAQDLFVVFAAPNRWNNGQLFSVISRFATKVNVKASTEERPVASRGDESGSEHPVDEPAEDGVGAQGLDDAAPSAEPAARATVSTMFGGWRTSGKLRSEDTDLTVPDFNLRLAEAGILDGAPGRWRPTRLATLLGVIGELRTGHDGEPYILIEYTSEAQELLLRLYLEGKI